MDRPMDNNRASYRTLRVGDTATTAAINWLNDNCVGSHHGPEATAVFPTSPFLSQPEEDGVGCNNISQLSVTMTEDDFLNLKASSSNPEHTSNKGRKNNPLLDDSYASSSLNDAPSNDSTTALRKTVRSVSPPPSLPRPSRKVGPKETLYRQHYSAYVSERIQCFRTAHNVANYRSMTKDQQSTEQKRVLDLLERLRMVSLDSNDSREPDSPAITNQWRSSACSTDSEGSSEAAAPRESLVLLSPLQPNENPVDFPQDDVSETSSIENVRASQYHSPNDRFERKRIATSSGKRGADSSRLRLDSDDPLAKSIGRLALGNDHIFTSSQSPIESMTSSPIRSSSTDEDDDIPDPMDTRPNISFGSDTLLQSKQYDNDTLVETAMLPDKKVRWDFEGLYEKEAPTDVRLCQGAFFHLPTILACESFPDPFRFYPELLQSRLNRLCRWLNDHYERALVMSMQRQHFIDVILKQELKKPIKEQETSKQVGNMLVVAREKEDLESWSRSFREGSAFSVLNHAMMPAKERKSLSGSAMAAQYDLVLTTYDCFKSSDVVVALDERNHAKLPAREVTGAWCSVSQPQQGTSNKKLSFLHRLRWRKLVFTDIVGKKSYLAKGGTARQQAAVAVQAESRSSGIKALKRSDNGSLNSMIDVLHIADDLPKEVLREAIVDFRVSTRS